MYDIFQHYLHVIEKISPYNNSHKEKCTKIFGSEKRKPALKNWFVVVMNMLVHTSLKATPAILYKGSFHGGVQAEVPQQTLILQ
jgi:hypothetical protein